MQYTIPGIEAIIREYIISACLHGKTGEKEWLSKDLDGW